MPDKKYKFTVSEEQNLKRVDQVAYVRFASVYRDFQDIKEFAEEISSLSKEKPKTPKKKK